MQAARSPPRRNRPACPIRVCGYNRSMSVQLLATKLYAPPHRPKLVLRPSLIERLNEGLHRKLTLISAPAGFGKTTLASEWIAGCRRPAAWLSLDEGDCDLTRFLTYLISALQMVKEDFGANVSGMLQAPQPAPTESVLTSLVNDLSTIPDSFTLVLDDYHTVDAKPVDDALAFILEHSPPQMHLVITTREDPNLPLAKWRARGQLTELRAADLRFTGAETAKFFNQAMGLGLSQENIITLENRTEGWIAGLQMAALSLQGRTDTSSFIQAFSGSHRFVLDYLLEEVLHGQTAQVHDFLLQTAILDRLCGSLCNAVTGGEDSGAMLDALDRANLFIVPLDDKRQWYRYHHLFSDVLKGRLLASHPDRVSALHLRASEWFEQNDLPPDAIAHAFAANDFVRAAGQIELAWPAMEGRLRSATWLAWARQLPDGLVRTRPVLCVCYALALLESAEMEASDSRLKDAERLLANPSAEMIIADREQFRTLPAKIAVARAYHAQALGDVQDTEKYARLGLELLPEGDNPSRGQLSGLLGLSCWVRGDLEAAARTFTDFSATFRAVRNVPDAIGTAFVLADIRMAQGHLNDAASVLEQSLQYALDQDGPISPSAADLYRGLCELSRTRGDLESAARHLSKGKELGGQSEQLGLQYRLSVAHALMRQSQGDLDGALNLLCEADRLYIRTPLPVVHPIPAMKARIWVAQGKRAEAMDWASGQGLTVDDELNYLHEFDHITLARVLLAWHTGNRGDSLGKAMRLLGRLLQAAEENGRTGSMIEILVLQTLAHNAKSDIPSALVSLEKALTLAEPEGFVRIFLDEGPTMADLLARMATSHGNSTPAMGAYIQKLRMQGKHSSIKDASPASLSQGLIEPLTQRELEVLGLIGQGLSNQEIGDRLFLALDTIKGHNRRIFEKLCVRRRTEALTRARELGLLR